MRDQIERRWRIFLWIVAAVVVALMVFEARC